MIGKIWPGLRGLSTILCAVACAATGVTIITQVLSRLTMGQSFIWVEEISQLAVILTVFFGLVAVEHTNGHLTLEIMFTMFPKAAFYLQIIGKLLMAVYASFIVYSAGRMLPAARRILAPASKIPIRYVYYSMIFGCVLWIIQTVINMVLLIKERRKGV
ncbi:TRAP transporter small permease subunit [Lachnospiraceae bacterium 62-35]